MKSLTESFNSLLSSIPSTDDATLLDETIDAVLKDTQGVSNTKQWEFLFRNAVLDLAATEAEALKTDSEAYYKRIQAILDLVLRLTEKGICDQPLAFVVLGDLLETQTVASCSEIFSWVEHRSKRLTVGMEPAKGKSLNLLRTLNDLLRRLSKTGNTTILCGRILAFLSSVFPLSERSAVNLRGEYGSRWDGPNIFGSNKEDETKQEGATAAAAAADPAAMDVDVPKPDAEKPNEVDEKAKQKTDFYNTFWSLQLPFSQPTVFAEKGFLAEFQKAVNKVLPVIKEATAKERAMMGSRASAGGNSTLKRKREPELPLDTSSSQYFFAKFLTSPELLELEIADTHFRRQFLFQLLVLLNHLLTFTKFATSSWYNAKNRSLQMDFVLDPSDAQWVRDTIHKATEELRQTSPSGRIFADTVNSILERDKNWIRWKNEGCPPFDKDRWTTEVDGAKVGLVQAAVPASKKLREDPPDWPWKLGNEPLTEIWELGYRDLYDLQNPFLPGTIKDYVKKIKQEDARMELRKKQLEKAASAKAALAAAEAAKIEPTSAEPAAPRPIPATVTQTLPPSPSPLHPSLPAKPGTPSKPPVASEAPSASSSVPPAAPQQPPDPMIIKYEEAKQRWSWFALRTARDQYLHHFEKIESGNILLLAEEIENAEKREREEKENALLKKRAPSVAVEITRASTPGTPSQTEDGLSAITPEAPSIAGPDDHAVETGIQEQIDDVQMGSIIPEGIDDGRT